MNITFAGVHIIVLRDTLSYNNIYSENINGCIINENQMYYTTTFIIVYINICDNMFHANDIILFIGHAVMCLCLSIFLLITSLLMYASLSVLIYRIDTSKCLQYELIELLISRTIQLTYMYPECCTSMLLSQMSLLALRCLVIHVHVPGILCNVACSDIIKGCQLYSVLPTWQL